MSPRTFTLVTALLLPAVLLSLPASCDDAPSPPARCGQPGQWLARQGDVAVPVDSIALMDRLARRQVVLLGETHDSAEDHRWQLHVLARLHSRQPAMAIGFEMFPRRLQPVLDEWVSGTLSEQDFLNRAEWDKVWGYDARDYLPLFHFARMNRIPMLALNVERGLIDALGKEGWDAVPEARKEGVSRPAPPTPEYLKALRAVFDQHPAATRNEANFTRFVEAQAFWDRAMAETMAEYLKKRPESLVVGILGAGHVRHGHGVAHQLKSLGVERTSTLLTWDHGDACAEIVQGMADAVYVVRPPAGAPPRLGVTMEADAAGVRITHVVPGSVAEKADLKAGDVVLEVAGQPARSVHTLRGAVQRQAPGTWLPMKIRREGKELELVARFPAGA